MPVTSTDSVCQIEELPEADSTLPDEAEDLVCSVDACVVVGKIVFTIDAELVLSSTASVVEVSAPTQIVLVRVALTVTVRVPMTLRSLMSLE